MSHYNLLAHENEKLEDHLLKVAKGISIFTKNRAEIALGVLHDIGKVSKKFQRKIRGEKNRFRHPIAALPIAKYILEDVIGVDKKSIKVYLTTIYYHHNSLNMDMILKDIETLMYGRKDKRDIVLDENEQKQAIQIIKALFKKCKEMRSYTSKIDYARYRRSYSNRYTKIILNTLIEIKEWLDEGLDTKEKMLLAEVYEHLVEADWKSTSKIISSEKKNYRWVDKSLEKIKKLPKRSKIDGIRQMVKRELLKPTNLNKNIVMLSAPTGSGKTEAALAWGLSKMKTEKKDRLIFILPYNAIIEDMYKRFNQSYFKDKVDVYNAEYIFYIAEEKYKEGELNSKEDFNFYRALKKHYMDKPVILTTADQVLNSFFNVGRYLLRYSIFNNSVIIFDEIHGYDPEMRFLIYQFIERVCVPNKIPVLLMTATDPEDYKNLNLNFGENREFAIVKNEKWFKDMSKMKEIKISIVNENKDWKKEIIRIAKKEIEGHNSLAIIVNTVSKSIELKNKIEEEIKDIDVYLLHSRITKEDIAGVPGRNTVIEKINEAIKKNRKFILVSTQVLETGVDYDFDVIIREIAPLTSIVQAMGRVNRNGLKKHAKMYIINHINLERKTIDMIVSIAKKEIEGHNSLAIIVNTVSKSIELKNKIEEEIKDIDVYLLHSRITKEDIAGVPGRNTVIEKINEAIKKNRKFILVSTQVLETGVDYDFDVIIREIAPLTSIVNKKTPKAQEKEYVDHIKNEEIEPYSERDMVRTEEIIKALKKCNRSSLENEGIKKFMEDETKKQIDKITFDNIKYITGVASSYAWSVKSIRPLLGKDLREDPSKESVIIEKEDESTNNLDDLEGYIKYLKDQINRTISVLRRDIPRRAKKDDKIGITRITEEDYKRIAFGA